MKKIYVLGAGASIDAGIPSANQLTEEIVKEFPPDLINSETPQKNSVGYIINSIVGGLIFDQATSGTNPYQGVSIEKVLNVLSLLENRYNNGLDAFITGWHPAIDLKKSDALHWNGTFIPSHSGYQTIKELITHAVIRKCCQKDLNKIEYFKPFVRKCFEEKSVIATLNYDINIERATEGICGYKYPAIDGKMTFNLDEEIKLYKLHGSINWLQSKGVRKIRPQHTDLNFFKFIDEQDSLQLLKNPERLQSSVILGGENKLSAKYPYLVLMAEFYQEVMNSREIIIIGYSFQDPHINEILRQWNFYPKEYPSSVTIVDKSKDSYFLNRVNEIFPQTDESKIVMTQTAAEYMMSL